LKRSQPSKIVERIKKLLADVHRAEALPGAYPYLPDIAKSLEAMLENVDTSPSRRDKMAGGLGRIVTEDYAFSESDLGGRILRVADDFAQGSEM
jgi:hypothetical protein